jgi:hypothetical protein
MMMRWLIGTLLALGLAGIILAIASKDEGTPPLSSYKHVGDAIASVLPLSIFGIYPCASSGELNGSRVLVWKPAEDCYKMLPAQRYQGIWLDAFEGSEFFEGAKDARDVEEEMTRRTASRELIVGVWVNWPATPASTSDTDSQSGRLFAVEFIGRRTEHAGRFGHLGMFQHEMVVDQVISQRALDSPGVP